MSSNFMASPDLSLKLCIYIFKLLIKYIYLGNRPLKFNVYETEEMVSPKTSTYISVDSSILLKFRKYS